MVRRHPHVYEFNDERSSEEQTIAWEDIKAQERAGKPKIESLLDDVPIGLPALTRAIKLQKRAARVGFDWPTAHDVLDKIKEEADELTEAIDSKNQDHIEDEYGDLLFALANLSRHLNVDPENAVRRTNEKFTTRFRYVEKAVEQSDRLFKEHTLSELEEYWQAAKAK